MIPIERRLRRAADAATATPTQTAEAFRIAEAASIADEAAEAFRRRLEGFKKYSEEMGGALADILKAPHPALVERIERGPPSDVSWGDLETLGALDPARMQCRWEEIKQAALDELRSGQRAVRVLQTGNESCWERARFLAMRAELLEAWRPRDAQERMIIDQLAQWQALLWHWQQMVSMYAELEQVRVKRAVKKSDEYDTPRLSAVETLEHATCQVERYQRLYERTVRLLQQRRRQNVSIHAVSIQSHIAALSAAR